MGLFHRQRRARSRWEAGLEYSVDEPLILDSFGFGPKGVFDPLGSYTGVPEDGEEPEQDADDL